MAPTKIGEAPSAEQSITLASTFCAIHCQNIWTVRILFLQLISALPSLGILLKIRKAEGCSIVEAFQQFLGQASSLYRFELGSFERFAAPEIKALSHELFQSNSSTAWRTENDIMDRRYCTSVGVGDLNRLLPYFSAKLELRNEYDQL